MKSILFALVLLLAAGCGYTSRNNEAVGQIKKIKNVTPMVWPAFTYVDVSLGVMRGGTGSMSSQDIWLRADEKHLEVLQSAQNSGQIVRIFYDEERFNFWYPEEHVTSVELLE